MEIVVEKISHLSFKPDITAIRNLKLKGSYFSRAMNKKFTLIENDLTKRILKLGIDTRVVSVTYALFNKQYLKEGIVEN